MKKLSGLIMFLIGCLLCMTVFAAEGNGDATAPAPVLAVIGQVIGFLQVYFPKAGPIIQLVMEIIASIGTFFTLATVFVIGTLKIPYVMAKWSGAHDLADKIQKLSDKITPYLKYFSIFNSPKK